MELDGLNWSFWDSLQSIFPLNFKPDHPSLNGSISSVDKILQSNKSFASPSKIQILFIYLLLITITSPGILLAAQMHC